MYIYFINLLPNNRTSVFKAWNDWKTAQWRTEQSLINSHVWKQERKFWSIFPSFWHSAVPPPHPPPSPPRRCAFSRGRKHGFSRNWKVYRLQSTGDPGITWLLSARILLEQSWESVWRKTSLSLPPTTYESRMTHRTCQKHARFSGNARRAQTQELLQPLLPGICVSAPHFWRLHLTHVCGGFSEEKRVYDRASQPLFTPKIGLSWSTGDQPGASCLLLKVKPPVKWWRPTVEFGDFHLKHRTQHENKRNWVINWNQNYSADPPLNQDSTGKQKQRPHE